MEKGLTAAVSRYAYVALRIVAGICFAMHGAQKLFGAFGGHRPPMLTLLWFAGIIELAGGLLVACGLYTRIVAFLLAGEMAVAYFTTHFPKGFWPLSNGGELAVLYCFVFLYLAASGK